MSDSNNNLSEKEEISSLPPLSRMLISNDGAVGQTATTEDGARVGHWMVATDIRYLLVATFALLHGTIFSYSFWSSHTKEHLTLAKSTSGMTLPIANAAAAVLYFDLAVLIFPVCQTLTSVLKRTPLSAGVHYDTSIFFHRMIGWCLVFFALVHTISHWVNFASLAVRNDLGFKGFLALNFGIIPGWSGYVMLIILGLIAVTSLETFRLASFERFYYTHHLFVIFFIISSVHSVYCIVKEDTDSEGASTCGVRYGPVWQWLMYAGLCYLLVERVKKELVGRYNTYISKVIRHPCNVVEIQVKKEKTRMKIGQYIYICCPEVSLWQHRPFLLTSAPEEDYLSVHIHCTSSFTNSIAASVGCEFEHQGNAKDIFSSKVIGIDQKAAILDVDPTIRRPLPRVFIGGPFGGAWEDIFEYKIAMLIGAGTGIMPFASILKSIWYRMNYPQQKTFLGKIYFFWYLTGAIQCDAASELVKYEEYAEQSAIAGLRTPTVFGRPNWDTVFESICNLHASPEKVGVFFSGPSLMGRKISAIRNNYSKDGFMFVWKKGNF